MARYSITPSATQEGYALADGLLRAVTRIECATPEQLAEAQRFIRSYREGAEAERDDAPLASLDHAESERERAVWDAIAALIETAATPHRHTNGPDGRERIATGASAARAACAGPVPFEGVPGWFLACDDEGCVPCREAMARLVGGAS